MASVFPDEQMHLGVDEVLWPKYGLLSNRMAPLTSGFGTMRSLIIKWP